MALNQPVYELGSWMCMGYRQQHDMADFKWENDDQSAFFGGGVQNMRQIQMNQF